MANEVVLDTSALVEYADGSQKGVIVRDLIESQKYIVVVPSIVLAEFSSISERKGFAGLDKFLELLRFYTVFLEVEPTVYINAGKRHAKLRKFEKDISVVDSIIMEIADVHGGALIISTDPHFKNYKNSQII